MSILHSSDKNSSASLLQRQSLSAGRLPMLDCCRGIAALFVVMFHAATTVSLPKYFKVDTFDGGMLFGARGVDFFFVLSGFIITYVHWSDLGRLSSLPQYLKKRVVRVYPILWFVALPLIAISPYLTPDRIPGDSWGRIQLILGSLLLLPTRIPPIPAVSWTLKHEIVFYAVFAGIIWKPRAGAALLTGWFGCCVWHAIYGNETSGFLSDFFLSPYNIEFIFGVCVGTFVRCCRVPRPGWLVVFGLLWLFCSSVFYRPVVEEKPWVVNATSALQVAEFGLGSVLVILGLSQLDIDGRFFLPKWTMLLGSASYSIYLVHFPVISVSCKILVAVRRFVPMSSFVAFLLVSALGVIAGIALHVLIEAPLLRRVRRTVIAPSPDYSGSQGKSE